MKKLIAMLLCVLMVVALAACKPAQPAPEATTAPAVATEAPAPVEPAAEAQPVEETAAATLKTGYAVNTSVASSASAGEKDGNAQADTLFVAVAVDADGKITSCAIDSVQSKVAFSKEGKLLTDLGAAFKTKQELGTEYGMSKASPIGQEWNAQADAFAAYCVGKTAEEVRGIALSEQGTPADADLSAGCTMHIGEFISIVAKAADSAAEMGAMAGDKAGVSASTNISKSKDATAEEAGLAQAYSTYAFVTVDASGKITSCILDATQANVNFDATGAITTDLNAAVQTKNELGEAYGMKKASAIDKEWNEQAAAFSAYCIGKTADEVKGIAMDETGLAADADLLAGCTVHIGEFMNVVATAAMNAK